MTHTRFDSDVHLYDLEIISNIEIAPGIFAMRYRAPELAQRIKPGQFFNLALPNDPSQILRLPFSWAVKDEIEGWIEFAYLIVGDGTRKLSTLSAGSLSSVVGPAGNGWHYINDAKRALVVGGGSGVVPTVPLVRELINQDVEVDYVQGARNEEMIIYEDRLLRHGAHFYVTTDDGSRGVHGFSTVLAQELIAQHDYDIVYTCGPTPMMCGIASAANNAHIPCQVSMERLMACGFGACTTCLVDTKHGRLSACKDGPIFNAEEVKW